MNAFFKLKWNVGRPKCTKKLRNTENGDLW